MRQTHETGLLLLLVVSVVVEIVGQIAVMMVLAILESQTLAVGAGGGVVLNITPTVGGEGGGGGCLIRTFPHIDWEGGV